ncbi:MAG: DUF1566 domain-containing protein, partial [Chlorobiaceae bacterium]|nr:DUF1566 domain-containing protein [Chlorobiaceae bacterium]
MAIRTTFGIRKISCALFFLCLSLFALSSLSSAASISIGSDYGGGKIAYIFQPGDPGYIAGQQRGIVVANKEISGTHNWSSAISVCESLKENGFDDWYLPSKDELEKLYANRVAIGGISVAEFWSSTEQWDGYAWGIYSGDGYHFFSSKANSGRVLPVRIFSVPSANSSPQQLSGS